MNISEFFIFGINFEQYNRMESNDGFRRRAAIVSSEKQFMNIPEMQSKAQSGQHTGRDNYIKFSKINANNHAILMNRKKDQQFRKTIKQVQNRKCTFYRMGFRSYQKQGQKKLFGQVLGLHSGQMKGTMYVGELWANHEVGKFFKENKIFMTKLKLMDKLQVIKREYDQAEKNDSESDIGVQSCRSIATFHHVPFENSNHTTSHSISTNKLQLNKSFEGIHGKLKQLKADSGRNNLMSNIKYLERCKQRLDKVQKKYFLKMIDLQ